MDYIRALKLFSKEVISLKDGSFLGKIQAIPIDAKTRKVLGINIKLKGILGGKKSIPFSGIQAFGDHSITIKENYNEDKKDTDEKDIMNMPVITLNGTLLGRIDDFYFNAQEGSISEYVITEGLVQDTLRGKAILKNEKIFRIGKDVMVVDGEFEDAELEEYVEVEILKKENEDDSKTRESLERIWQQSMKKVKDLSEELSERIDKVGEEARGIFSEAQYKTQRHVEKVNLIKEEWQKKINLIRGRKKDDIADKLLIELKGKIVKDSLYDEDNNLIISAGDAIDDDIIKSALEKGKIYDLFILAAVKDVEDELEKDIEKSNQ